MRREKKSVRDPNVAVSPIHLRAHTGSRVSYNKMGARCGIQKHTFVGSRGCVQS